jgi:hypothetical protein
MPGSLTIKSISVDLEVMTKDRLKRIVFGLDKTPEGEDVKWLITFEFYERDDKNDEFGEALVKLNVDVRTKNHDAAEQTARKGLNTPQAEHLLGPVAIDTKRLKAGKIKEEKLASTVEKTIEKRKA